MITVKYAEIPHPKTVTFSGGYYVVVSSGGTVLAAFQGENMAAQYLKDFNPGSWSMGYVET